MIRSISTPTGILTLALLFSLTACEGRETDIIEGAGADMAPDDSVNVLTTADREDGWDLLFNGQNLNNWKGFKSDSISSKWVIDDHAIHFDPDEPGEGGDIMTAETYEDFELSFEWKIGECGNSGVIYLAEEADERENTWVTGPEYQILDDTCHPDAEVGPDRRAGAAYDVYGPSEDITRPAGEWNESRILVDDSRIEHWLNGTKVVEYERGGDDWQTRIADSKWTDYPDYGTVEEGHIALQDHGDPVWFRKMKIRRL